MATPPRNPSADALLYSVAEAANLLHIGETACRELIATGRLRVVKMPPGGRTRVPRAALDEFIASLEDADQTVAG